MGNENDIIIERSDIGHEIDKECEVIRTDLGKYSKIVHIANQGNSEPTIRKLNKYEYIDLRINKIKSYDLDKPTDLKSVKRKLRQYEEKVLYNFPGGKNEIFVTLTCREHITNLAVIKNFYNQFIDNLKSMTDYEDLEHIGQFEQSENWCWHVHAFIKTDKNKSLFIEQPRLKEIWEQSGVISGGAYVMQNLNTMQTLNHSKEKREDRLERFRYFPKGERMCSESNGIAKPPKERLLYKECPEVVNADKHKTISNKTYVIRNSKTDNIINEITTQMFKEIKSSINKQQQSQEQNKIQNQVQASSTNDNAPPRNTKTEIKSKIIKVVVSITFIIFDIKTIFKKVIYFWKDKF